MSLHDPPDVNAQMDTSPIQSPSGTITPAFSSLVPSQSEDSLLPSPLPQTPHDSITIFPNTLDPSTLPLSLPDSSPVNAGITPMDTLSVSSSTRAPAPGFISDFPPPSLSFGATPLLDSHLSVQSPQSTSSGSSSQSPAMLGMGSAFALSPASVIPTVPPSVTSAMSLHTPVSAAESSSSSTLVNSVSELSFSPLSGVPPSGQEPGFIFPPPDVVDPRIQARDSSPDTPNDAHLMVVGDMLKNIAQTAQSASAACSLGQGSEANARIDELKKTIALVSELIAATQIADPPPGSRKSSPRRFSAASNLSVPIPANSASPPARLPTVTAAQDTGQIVIHDLSGMDASSDTSDLSRKRCASSMGGDRVIKAMKMEPQEDTPLHIIPPPVTSAPAFPPTTVPSMVSFVSPTPPEAASRPTSSTDLPIPPFNLLSHQPAQPTLPAMGFPMAATSASTAPADFISTSSLPTAAAHFPSQVRASWSDGAATIPARSHRHSLSGSSITTNPSFQSIPSTSTGLAPLTFSSAGTFATASSQPLPIAVGGAGISPPIGRVSRSASFTNSNVNTFTFGLPEMPPAAGALDFLQPSFSTMQANYPHSPTSSQEGDDVDSDAGGDSSHSQNPESSSGSNLRTSAQVSVSRSVASQSRSAVLLTRNSTESISTNGNEVPQEYRAEVDRIFFEFLNSVCSNLEATDAKGEPIHQTLMAKKMQRLDESPDFRPFKFRIQAFTNAFLEELARQGYPEDKIPMKKIRNYLWNQPYISRFNEEGKKTKSKGNHIWNIDAKKLPDGGWTFRPFHRKVAGSPPAVAYVGLRWSWAPRIWDPQASRTNLQVTYASPSLPSWLSWDNDVLQGTPPPDAESCDITVMARCLQDGVEEQLTQTFHLSIAPVSTLDGTFPSRRSSLNSDKARRLSSDPGAPQLTPPRALRSATMSTLAPPVTTHDAQVMQVLTTAAQRVAQEAQCQVIASKSSIEHGPELQALAKQQHVLTVTAQAFDQEVSGQRSDTPLQTNVLAVAAQQVVLQAARQVAADRSAAVASQISAGLPPPPVAATQVTVNEVSVATQSAVAQAVEITGPLSSEVDVLITASSLLQQHLRAPVSPPVPMLDPTRSVLPLDGAVSTTPFPPSLTAPTSAIVPYPPSAPLADFNRLT